MDVVVLKNSTREAFSNAERLFEDAKNLYEWDSYPTAYALCILAQEEYGKSFLLHLASENAVPWSGGLERALRNHKCKQLVALIMDYLQRKDFSDLLDDPDSFRGASTLPSYVLDAIHIIVHEHVRGLTQEEWLDESAPLHPTVKRIARGMIDREKQTGFYVEVGADGKVGKNPSGITPERCKKEVERTGRVASTLYDHEGIVRTYALELPKIAATFQVLSGLMPEDEFNQSWWR